MQDSIHHFSFKTDLKVGEGELACPRSIETSNVVLVIENILLSHTYMEKIIIPGSQSIKKYK